MSNLYYPGILPGEYNQAFLNEELQRIAQALSTLEVPTILLAPQAIEPTPQKEGMVVSADGVNWNPGHGVGLYEYKGGKWSPLFAVGQGFTTTQIVVENTTTETEIYSTVVGVGSLTADTVFVLKNAGNYDTGAASDTWTMRFKVGGTTVHSVTRHDSGNVAGSGWECTMEGIMKVLGASGSFQDLYVLLDKDTVSVESSSTTHGIDTTVANTLSVTVQWGAAKAGNIFRFEHGVMDFKH